MKSKHFSIWTIAAVTGLMTVIGACQKTVSRPNVTPPVPEKELVEMSAIPDKEHRLDVEHNTAPYNLNVILNAPGDFVPGNQDAFGFIHFHQNPDTSRIIDLHTWIFGLQADHDYILQRAVNPITDNDCTSIAWLTLGLGLTPQSIHTDDLGRGHADLWRAVTAIARETQFRIHFQIVDQLSNEVVLSSDCYAYTVR